MRVPRIYTSQPLASNSEFELEASPSHHLLKVLRMETGRPLIVFDGRGGEYTAEFLASGINIAKIRTNQHTPENKQSPLSVSLAIGISRGDKMEWVLQKACELGVQSITPLFTERTEVKLSGERLKKKLQGWEQLIISSCEQCQRNILPELKTPLSFEEYLPHEASQLKLVLHHRTTFRLENQQAPESACILIGPEGGLSDTEIEDAEKKGFKALTLGPRVLRTETAPLAALSVLQYLWGDF